MSETAVGYVQKIISKNLSGRVYYSFVLDNDQWYRTGTIKPKFSEGDKVRFEYEAHEKYGNQVDMNTVESKAGEAPKVSQGKSAGGYAKKGGGGGGRGAQDAYWQQKAVDDRIRQNTISYQAATNTAVDILKVALEQDAVSLGSKKADKLDNLVAQVLTVADELYGQYLNADDRAAILKEGMETDDSDIVVDDTPPPAPETKPATDDGDDW